MRVGRANAGLWNTRSVICADMALVFKFGILVIRESHYFFVDVLVVFSQGDRMAAEVVGLDSAQ